MAGTDGENVEGKDGTEAGKGADSDEAVIRAAIENDEDQEGFEDEDGKPLPWNHPKRLRRVYEGSKEGRKALKALKELGLKHSDLPKLREEMGRLQAYDRAYQQYLEAQKAGETDDDDDEQAAEVRKKVKSLKAQLKSLGVKFEEDAEEDDKKRQAATLAQRKAEVVGRARERITELLEDAGVDFKSMDPADKKDLIEEFDFKIGQKMARDEEAIKAFVSGSVRPIERFFKEVVKQGHLPVTKKKGTGITQLPPRTSGSSQGSSMRRDEKKGAPKTVRDVTDEIVADLKARNAARRAEEE